MSLPHYSLLILKDLSAGQSTADSTAGRLGITDQRCQALLRQLLADGYVAIIPIQLAGKPALTVYRLTAKPIL